MPYPASHSEIVIRELRSFDDLSQIESIEREVWGLADIDITPLTFTIASREAGCLWVGAFDGKKLVGFAFGFLGLEHTQLTIHSHMLAILPSYRDLNLGCKLKLAQRELALALRMQDSRSDSKLLGCRINEITWTFDPLHSRNAHLNFAKLGVLSDRYIENFYGPQTSSSLHRNGTDRLWVRWPISARRVQLRVRAKDDGREWLDALRTVGPLLRFDGDSRPVRSDSSLALSRYRAVIEIPSNILAIEETDFELAKEWRSATRWAFTEALISGLFVAEFCRTIRGQQGPGAYLLERGTIEDYLAN